MAMTNTTLFLAGDVMTGRGLDQAMQHPGSPTLHEPSVRDARRYRDLCRSSYGCGDLIDDDEGIAGHGRYRSDLGIMYFPTLEVTTGRLVGLAIVPMQMRSFQLCHVDEEGVNWLRDTLCRVSHGFGCSVGIQQPNVLSLRW